MVQDISRDLDYLDTRNDIIHDRFGYFGVSWGSAMSPVVCSIEKRFKAAVLHSGGLMIHISICSELKTIGSVTVIKHEYPIRISTRSK